MTPLGIKLKITNNINYKIMEIKINVSEGYEIDKENSTELNILFKKIDTQKKWCNFGLLEGYYIQANSEICKEIGDCTQENRNVFPTKKEAEACLALSQLTQWRDKANGEPLDYWFDWEDRNEKFCIQVFENVIKVLSCVYTSSPIVFKTEKIAEQFLIDHKDLLEIAKTFL